MRAGRQFTGAKTRVHVIRPLASSLRAYRVIELHPLSNLLPGHVPPSMEREIGDRVDAALSHVSTTPSVTRMTALDLEARRLTPDIETGSALVVEEFLDDYDVGSRTLRIVELGFNHIAVTVRVQLHDRRSNAMLGSISVTAEDDRETGTAEAAITRVAGAIGGFVGEGYAR